MYALYVCIHSFVWQMWRCFHSLVFLEISTVTEVQLSLQLFRVNVRLQQSRSTIAISLTYRTPSKIHHPYTKQIQKTEIRDTGTTSL